MKPLLSAIAAAIFLLLPAPGFPAYIIHLHDGTQFVTDQYYKEGDQMKIKVYGGLIGIQEDQVREIIDTEKELPERQMVRSKPERTGADAENKPKEKVAIEDSEKNPGARKSSGANATESVNEKGAKDEDDEEKKDQQYYMKEKASLDSRLKKALEEYKKAKQAGDDTKTSEHFHQASQLANELEELKKEVKRQNFGNLPYWWDQIR
jgi:hypothetical protein